MTCQLLEKELSHSRAMAEASNAHCTIMKRAESAARAELLRASKKSKTRRAIKMTARYVAHDTMKEIHAKAQEKAQRARETAEKEAQKAKEEAVREARIQEETRTRIFTGA